MNCIIVDDERNAIDLLKTFVQDYCPIVKVIDSCKTVDTAFESIVKNTPDFIFLDIKIGHQTGFELLDKFGVINFNIIFTTAYSEYSLKAFDYGALHYLTKPIDIDKLQQAVGRLKGEQANLDKAKILGLQQMLSVESKKRLALPTRQGNDFIDIDDIAYCESSGSYAIIHLINGKQKMISKPLAYLETRLEGFQFCRIHKKYMVNLEEVVALHKGKTPTCLLKNGMEVSVSATYRNNFEEFLRKKIVF